MKLIATSLLIGSLLVFVGCATRQPIDTKTMIGMRLGTCVTKHRLDEYKNWWMPNLPEGSDSEVTYFLRDGNLFLKVDSEDRITFATFDQTDESPEDRLRQVHAGWHKWVEAHIIKKTQPSPAGDSPKAAPEE